MFVLRHIPSDTYFKNVYSVPGEFKVKLVPLQEAMVFTKEEKAINNGMRWLGSINDWEVREVNLVLV